MGQGKCRPPVAHERILMKPRIYNYAAGMTTHVNPNDAVQPAGRNVSNIHIINK